MELPGRTPALETDVGSLSVDWCGGGLILRSSASLGWD